MKGDVKQFPKENDTCPLKNRFVCGIVRNCVAFMNRTQSVPNHFTENVYCTLPVFVVYSIVTYYA